MKYVLIVILALALLSLVVVQNTERVLSFNQQVSAISQD